MQEVVELPGLVADPEVVGLVPDHVVEDHEVREQDLIHPPDRLERVQPMAVALGADVRRLAGQIDARRVDSLAGGGQHLRDRMLRQPVDLQIGT